MKRFELKDKERQAALEKVFPGFGRDLQAACDDEFNDKFSHVCVRLSHGGGLFRGNGVDIKKTAIHTREAYNPRMWNDYPEVTPPERVLMQIECRDSDGVGIFHRSAYYEGERWYWETGKHMEGVLVKRFCEWTHGGQGN